MSFTYLIANDIGKLRLELGDTVSGTGVRPDGTNFTDEELQLILTREGSVGLAACAVCEILARNWARMADIAVGSRREDLGAVSKSWQDQAIALRAQYGGLVVVSVVDMTRDDGYHENNEHTDSDTEYGSDTLYIRT